MRRQPNAVEGPNSCVRRQRPVGAFHHEPRPLPPLSVPQLTLSEMPFAIPISQLSLPIADCVIRSRNFLGPPPAFQLLLARNGVEHLLKRLEIHESVAVIVAGKAFEVSTLVLPHAALDIVGHTNVQSAGKTGDDVRPVLMAHTKNALHVRAGVCRRGSFDSTRLSPRCAQDDRVEE